MLCSLTSPRTNFDERLIMMSFTCQQTFKWLPAGPLEYLFYCKLNLKTGNTTRRETTTTTTPCDPIQNSSGRVLMTCCQPACLPALFACLPTYLRHVIRWGFVSISYPVKTILITVAGIQLQGHNNTSAEPMPPQGFADATRQPGRQPARLAGCGNRPRQRQRQQAANSQRRPRSTGWLTDERFIEKFPA